jgi:hypothetical protein
MTRSGSELIHVLRDALMQWVIGSQPSYIIDPPSITVKRHMIEMVELGVGHLKHVAPVGSLDAVKDHPVYIDEPLTILSLSVLFEDYSWTQRKAWLTHSLSFARNKSLVGFIFEEMAMMALMEKFGGKFTALRDVFNFCTSSSMGRREVTLVSLTRMPNDIMSTMDLRQFGLLWFQGPICRGRPRIPYESQGFLFPHICMGPDSIGFLVDSNVCCWANVVLTTSRFNVTTSSFPSARNRSSCSSSGVATIRKNLGVFRVGCGLSRAVRCEACRECPRQPDGRLSALTCSLRDLLNPSLGSEVKKARIFLFSRFSNVAK